MKRLRECFKSENFWQCFKDYVWTVAGGLVLGGGIASYFVYTPPDPVELMSARIIETCNDGNLILATCIEGERMKIAYHVKWNETCPMMVDIFIFKEGVSQEIVYRNGPILAAFDRGDQKWVREVFIPPLPNGNYIYRARFSAKCKRGDHAIAVPDMDFQIKRPSGG